MADVQAELTDMSDIYLNIVRDALSPISDYKSFEQYFTHSVLICFVISVFSCSDKRAMF